jgi:hypothetical protein
MEMHYKTEAVVRKTNRTLIASHHWHIKGRPRSVRLSWDRFVGGGKSYKMLVVKAVVLQ